MLLVFIRLRCWIVIHRIMYLLVILVFTYIKRSQIQFQNVFTVLNVESTKMRKQFIQATVRFWLLRERYQKISVLIELFYKKSKSEEVILMENFCTYQSWLLQFQYVSVEDIKNELVRLLSKMAHKGCIWIIFKQNETSKNIFEGKEDKTERFPHAKYSYLHGRK